MICDWCGKQADSILMHVCEDGSTFDDRVRYGIQGLKPPSKRPMYSQGFDRAKNYDVLNLTPEDIDFLIGIKVRW